MTGALLGISFKVTASLFGTYCVHTFVESDCKIPLADFYGSKYQCVGMTKTYDVLPEIEKLPKEIKKTINEQENAVFSTIMSTTYWRVEDGSTTLLRQ
uniref:Uncharacterized protein n=1 Tax=Chromera velia CCMP2878 TaxID=1169474 RepID=A0A0G4IBE0_9ALVE|eukprot:Cvel_12818.t1-p1 / transcript=Cvel_12818.t1 / gene=Cvel_12818 / organism=Chromera_velia_CCMP2878 / gene_product=hypothetical protein / transcript_product=hypothetical protein / location=Cvel_scaffold854:46387-46677(+) / protein_length=97 / sequence_SO=supercontig / SO=protein_coding / is_pseudo=false